jgi:type VI secretion system protein ImpG
MSDELLEYYNRELRFIRRMGAEFAAANPRVAGNLRVEGERIEDPHVARLIEAFALLTARIRRKLDDEFPEITDALLNILYPHYLAPIPSTVITQFTLNRDQGKLTEGSLLPRGTEVETIPDQNLSVPCQFRTCFPVEVWPIEVAAASLRMPPFTCPQTPRSQQAASVLELQLRCLDDGVRFADMPIDRLRFFLQEHPPFVHRLYELLHNNAIEIAVANSPIDSDRVMLGPESIRPVGFELDEGLLDYPSRSFPGYRLLTEFFVFPEKFLFFEIGNLRERALRHVGNSLFVYIFFNRRADDLAHNISKDTFKLGCSPAVNLFSIRAEPIPLTQREPDYHVKVRERRPQAYEVYSIQRVTATSPDNEVVEFEPFYSCQHAAKGKRGRTYWYAVRRPAGYGSGTVMDGTEIYLSLVDQDFQPSAHADWTLELETTCLNRDLPRQLPFGGGLPRLQSTIGLPMEIRFLTRPTLTLRPALRQGARWRIISHLSLNHLSLVDNSDGADALREILSLYDFADSPETRAMIEGIAGVDHRPVVKRFHWDGTAAVCRGEEITIEFDEDKLASGCIYLLASVMERFMALYSSINSFTSLIARSKQREGRIRQWDPRAGEKVLV